MIACSYSSQVCRINRRQTRIVTAGASMKPCDSDAGCYDYGVTPITVHVRHRATTGEGHLTAAAVRSLASIINTPCALSRRSRLTELTSEARSIDRQPAFTGRLSAPIQIC